jgi:2-polyprenyl-6-methoxyphenol hydroxylase-like FAD-dependent oxidoreductase
VSAAGSRRAVVIGGGIGGLAAALALRQAGWEPAVFERAPEIREVGAGLTLWPNAVRALRRLGAADAVAATSATLDSAEVRDWRGRVLRSDRRDPAAVYGAPMYGAHRADLQAALADTLGRDVVYLGRTCTGYTAGTDGVTALFDDGSSERGELLVGADGLRSAVRRQLLGDAPPRYAGYTAWRGVAPSVHPAFGPSHSCVWIGRGAQFGVVPIGKNRTYWFGTMNAPAGGDGPGDHHADVLRRLDGWERPLVEVVGATPAGSVIRNDIIDRPPVQKWGEGRVTMLGDAAHPTTPNLGQGACQAIEGAVILGECLAAGAADPVAALRAYEARRRERTAFITNTSWELGKMAAWEGRLACWLRDRLIALMPQARMDRQTARVIGREV